MKSRGEKWPGLKEGGGGGVTVESFSLFFLQIAKLKAELLIAIIKMLTTIILAIKALITNNNHGIKIATIQ